MRDNPSETYTHPLATLAILAALCLALSLAGAPLGYLAWMIWRTS